jgi:glycosyltransferase involved in cell wall biosynthesis
MKSSKTVAILPAFNEARRIGKVIQEARKHVSSVLVVDDGSSDNTSEVAKKNGARVIRLENNSGVGYASRIGLNQAIKEKFDIIIFLDADGQLNPRYITNFIEKIDNGACYVYGRRNLGKYPLSNKIGNWGLTFLANVLCPVGIWDVECGYRAMTLEAARKMRLKSMKYEREMDFLYEVWRNKLKVSSVEVIVPIFHKKSRTRTVLRGFRNFWFLKKRRLHIV